MFRYLLIAAGTAIQAAAQIQTPAIDPLNVGKDAMAAHDYARAAEQFRAAIEEAGEPAAALEALRRLAAVTRLLGHPDEAEEALLRAAPIAAKLHGDTSLELASILSNLSGPQRALGKRKEALLSLESRACRACPFRRVLCRQPRFDSLEISASTRCPQHSAPRRRDARRLPTHQVQSVDRSSLFCPPRPIIVLRFNRTG